MLPGLTLSAAACDDTTGTLAGVARRVHRIREIALRSMVEGAARDRIERALRARTQSPGEAMELSVGDLVGHYRPSTSKAVPGCRGPAAPR